MHHSVERYFANLRAVMPADIDVEVLVAPAFSHGIGDRLRIMRAVRGVKADVVHVTGDITFAALGRPRRGTMLTILDSGFVSSASPRAAAVFKWLWMRLPGRRAARIVAISSFTADQFAEIGWIPRGRIDVVPVAVDDALTPQPFADNQRPVVLCFSTTPNKNADRIKAAVRDLDVELVVIDGTSSDAEMRDAYTSADVVAFPSLYEGFGMPIVEAQAIGRPVVTSDRAPMNETAGAGGACLVDPEDVASIRAGIERVLSDAAYREELIAKGLVNRERFRPAVAAEAYAAIYREMVRA